MRSAHRRFPEALGGAPAAQPSARRSPAGDAAIDYRAGALACGEEHVREAHAIAEELGDAGLQWRTLQRFGELAIARDDAAPPAGTSSRRSRLARREGLAAEEAVSLYSLGVARRSAGTSTEPNS